MLINKSQHARKQIHDAEGFRLHTLLAGYYDIHRLVTTYHDLIHTSLNTRGDLLDTGVCCDTDNRHMSNNFLHLLELANTSCTCQSIHDRHLDVQKDNRQRDLFHSSGLVECCRRQNFKSIQTMVSNMNLRTTCLAKLLGENLLVDCVVFYNYWLSAMDHLHGRLY